MNLAIPAAVRAGEAADIDACVAIWIAALEHRDGAVERGRVSEPARGKFDTRTVVRFGVAGDAPVGFGLTTDDGVVGGMRTALLELLAVAPSATGAGIGRELVNDAVDRARQATYDGIRLRVRVGNARAIALYRAAGFRPVSEPVPHPLGGQPMVTYWRDLAGEPGRA